MAKPTVEPNQVCVRTVAGNSLTRIVSIAKAPSAADVTVSIKNGGSLITLEGLSAFRLVHRAFTEQEIMELPPNPPSIRLTARKNGVIDAEEVATSDGTSPLEVSAGFQLQIRLRFSAPAQQAPEVTRATLVIEATTWEKVEIPLVLLVGTPTFSPTVEPGTIRRAAEPGETVTTGFAIRDIKQPSTIMVHVEDGGTVVRLKRVRVLRPIKKQFTEAEILELPPFPASIRQDARRNGYVEYREVTSGGSCSPLNVNKDLIVSGELEFAAPTKNPPLSVSATLVIEGTTWYRVDVPLFLVIGKITMVPSSSNITLRQGEDGDIGLTLTSEAGPSTNVDLSLGQDGGQWQISPSPIPVAQGATVSTTAKITVAACAPVGSYPVGIEVSAFDGLHFRSIPFQLTVLPGKVLVQPLQGCLVTQQGDRTKCSVQVTSSGYKRMDFTALRLPEGVLMHAPLREIGCGIARSTIDLDFAVDRNAMPVVNQRATVNWNAGDAEHKGTFDLSYTVTLLPESRTFTEQIITPPGTALGGWASITIRNDGSYTFSGHMHDSGFDPYSFGIGVSVRSSDGLIKVAAHKSGAVAGTLGSGSRDFDWEENGKTELIRLFWPELRNGTAHFTKSYEDTGVLGTLQDFADTIVKFFIGSVFVGAPVAAAIVIGSELGALTKLPFAHPGILKGIIVAGGITMILGPGVLLPAIIAGAVIGAQVRSRPMWESEEAVAATVFRDKLPIDRIRITDVFSPLNGRRFCVPSLDGLILIGMGDYYDDTLADEGRRRTLIHELAHAWQIARSPFSSEFYWKVAVDKARGDIAYSYVLSGQDWSDFGVEQQATIVSDWYYRWEPKLDSDGSILGAGAMNDAAFRYIHNNIRMGQT
jgi:hypothetical protein